MAIIFISRREGDPSIKFVCDTVQELNDSIGNADVGDIVVVGGTSLYYKSDKTTWTQII